MTETSTDRIRKQIQLNAPRSRVWRALTDSAEFGQWFLVELDGPFVVGEIVHGRITHPGCEHLELQALVERMEPERVFAYRWQPLDCEPGSDHFARPSTLVEFVLEEVDGGTRLTLTESGFDQLPEDARAEAFRRNDGGWTEQMQNIARHVGG